MGLRTLSIGFVFAVSSTVCLGLPRTDGDKPPAADPAAISAMKEAHDMRDAFPAGFPGFSADVVINDNGTELKGSLTYSAAGELKVTLTDAAKPQDDWAREQLGSALSHRRQTDFAAGEGKQPLTFGEDDHSPLGRKISLNDRMKSFYRVKDGRIVEVTRSMGSMRFTITVLETKIVEHGKYLPTTFVVTYFDGSTGAIKQSEAYTDGFTKVGGAWVPSSRRIVTAENGGTTTRTFALSNIRLASGAATARR